MVLRFTLVVGLPLWYLLAATLYGRIPTATFGPWVLALSLVLLAVLVTDAPRLAARAARAGAPGWVDALRLWVALLLLALPFLVFSAFAIVPGSGLAAGSPIRWGGIMAGLATPLAVPVLRTSLRRAAENRRAADDRPRGPTTARLLALAPLVAPLLALLLARDASFGDAYARSAPPPSAAGVLYYAIHAWAWLGALPIAFALDRLGGSPSSAAARGVVRAAFAVLALAVPLAAPVLFQLEGGSDLLAAPLLPWGSLAHKLSDWHPLSLSGGTSVLVPLPVDGLLAGGAALVLAVSAFTTWSVLRLARTRTRGAHGASLALLLAVQAGATLALLPAWGPAAAPWGGVLGVLAAAGLESALARGAPACARERLDVTPGA